MCDKVAAEAADVIYFMMTRCVAAGVGLREIEKHLDRRSLKVQNDVYVCMVCMVCTYGHLVCMYGIYMVCTYGHLVCMYVWYVSILVTMYVCICECLCSSVIVYIEV